jgi:hypothetical protein
VSQQVPHVFLLGEGGADDAADCCHLTCAAGTLCTSDMFCVFYLPRSLCLQIFLISLVQEFVQEFDTYCD